MRAMCRAAAGLLAAASMQCALAAPPQRAELLAAGEAALARGDAPAAIEALDKAALMLHSADTEMALVRAYLQQGEYRRALAFAAHVAGAHRDAPAATVQYAWLLALGGQGAFAQRTLNNPTARLPDDALLQVARQRLALPLPTTTPELRKAPHRLAPPTLMLGDEAAPPAAASVAATAVLLNDGQHALAPLAALGDASDLWLRNSFGETTRARVDRRMDAIGIALLRLSSPMHAGNGLTSAPRDPYAGSPGSVVSYAPSDDAAPAWPWLHQGFIGALDANAPTGHRLGIEVPNGAQGGPVFDAAGRWCGIAMSGTGATPALLPVTRLREAVGDLLPAPDGAPAARLAPDALYERAMRSTLQLIVAR